MPQVKWVIPCLRATIDETTKSLSLLEIIEGLTATIPPGTPPAGGLVLIPIQFDVAFLSFRQPGETPQVYDARVVLKDPKGAVLGTSAVKVDLLNGPGNRAVVRNSGLPVTSPGTYSFVAELLDPTTKAWLAGGQAEIEIKF
jgi:hypothetical protein